jgi:hypothetical protein
MMVSGKAMVLSNATMRTDYRQAADYLMNFFKAAPKQGTRKIAGVGTCDAVGRGRSGGRGRGRGSGDCA